MKALIASVVSIMILTIGIIETIDHLSLNIKLIEDAQPAFQGDYTNATENIAKTLTDYTKNYAYSAILMALLGPLIGIILGLLGLKKR